MGNTMPNDPVISEIVIKDLKYETESESSGEASDDDVCIPSLSQIDSSADSDTGEVAVLSPTDNSPQTVPAYSARWDDESETAGSVDEDNTYVECDATFTKATEDDVSISLSTYQIDVVGKSGKRYSDTDYHTLTVSGSNTVTIRFEFAKGQRPALIKDILSGVIYATLRDEPVVEAAST